MPFQYRIIKQLMKGQDRYSQLDLYFFKPKLSTVGVKIRFNTGQKDVWKSNQLELKIIKNKKDLQSNITPFQKWKKFQMPLQLTVFSKQYIAKHSEQFQIHQQHTINNVIREELENINKKICKAILSIVQKKHFEKNQDLKRWVSLDSPLVEVFTISKSRQKKSGFEIGQLRISPLYGQKKETFWNTLSYESHSEQQLREKINNYGEQNISYPKLLDKIYFG